VGVDIVPIKTVICIRRLLRRGIHREPPVTWMVAAARVVGEQKGPLWIEITTDPSVVKDGPTRADQQRSSVLPETQKPRTARPRPFLFFSQFCIPYLFPAGVAGSYRHRYPAGVCSTNWWRLLGMTVASVVQ
jgi:hypothetical protein